MKKTFLVLIALLGATTLMAQEQEVRIPSGYQGFLEQGNTYAFGSNGINTTGFSTTHGFYFNGHTFVGVGLAMTWGDDFFCMPIYTSVKYIFNNTRTMSPFIQLRLGSNIGDEIGTYTDMAIGLRFASRRDFAVNIMLAGTYIEPVTDDVTTYNYNNNSYTTTTIDKKKTTGIGFRVGIEW